MYSQSVRVYRVQDTGSQLDDTVNMAHDWSSRCPCFGAVISMSISSLLADFPFHFLEQDHGRWDENPINSDAVDMHQIDHSSTL